MERSKSAAFVTVPTAARWSGLGLRQLRRAIETGELPVFDIGGWPRVRWRDVEHWCEAQRRPTPMADSRRGVAR